MSYDICLRAPECPTCKRRGDEPDLPDPTYNLTPIFDRALTGEDLPSPEVSEMEVVLFRTGTDRPRGLRLLSGRKASDTEQWLTKALGHLTELKNKKVFRDLEPDNGWGTLPDAVWILKRLLEAAQEYPDSEWEIR